MTIEQINLKKLRRARGLTQHQLDEKIGVKHGRTKSYEIGQAIPPRDFLEAAVFALQIKDVDLFSKPLEEDLGVVVPQNTEPVLVPYWGVVPCGEWEKPEHDPTTVAVSGAFRGRKDIVAVRVTGESMWPLYKPDQVVPVRTISRKVEGAVSLIRNEDGELSLKVARRSPGGDWEFHSINPLYGRISGQQVELLGHAVHIPEVVDLEGIRL